jgi:G3E family GTPase
MRRREPIPITIATGPKGAGKTTLINRLLADTLFANSAVILNDFGEVALQNALVEKAEDGFIALGSGCVCCTVRGALTDGMEMLLRDLDNGRIAAIARVVIEADEAADPAAILSAVARHPYLSLRFGPDGIIAVLDATKAEATLASRADTVRQVAMADVVALSRSASVNAKLRRLNPRAAIVDASSVPAKTLVGYGAFEGDDSVDAWLGPASPESAADLVGEAARIDAFTVVRGNIIPIAALDRFLDYLAALQASNLIRVKGAVASGEGDMVIVDGYGGFFYPPLILDAPQAGAPQTRFSIVARDLDRKTFETYLDAFLNEARIDTPDRDALTDNPLAIAGFSARRGR